MCMCSGAYHIRPWEIERLDELQQAAIAAAGASTAARSSQARCRVVDMGIEEDSSCGSRCTVSPGSPCVQGPMPWELELLADGSNLGGAAHEPGAGVQRLKHNQAAEIDSSDGFLHTTLTVDALTALSAGHSREASSDAPAGEEHASQGELAPAVLLPVAMPASSILAAAPTAEPGCSSDWATLQVEEKHLVEELSQLSLSAGRDSCTAAARPDVAGAGCAVAQSKGFVTADSPGTSTRGGSSGRGTGQMSGGEATNWHAHSRRVTCQDPAFGCLSEVARSKRASLVSMAGASPRHLSLTGKVAELLGLTDGAMTLSDSDELVLHCGSEVPLQMWTATLLGRPEDASSEEPPAARVTTTSSIGGNVFVGSAGGTTTAPRGSDAVRDASFGSPLLLRVCELRDRYERLTRSNSGAGA